MPKRTRLIRQRLTAMSALSSSVALLLACSSFLAYELVTFRHSLVDDVNADAQVLAFNVAAPLLFNDPAAATTSLRALFQAKPRVRSALVTGMDGKIFASHGQLRSAPPAPATGGPWHRFESDGLVLGVPVLSEGSPIGMLTLVASLDERDQRIRRYLLLTGSTLVVALMIALGTSSLMQRRIVRPIMRLTDAAGQISRNSDYSVRVEAQTGDELGVLAAAFNDMIGRIEQKDAGLRASEERYRLLFENSPLPKWVYDLETLAFLAVNDAAVRHYGFTHEEFLRMTIKDIRPAEDTPRLMASVEQHKPLEGPEKWRHRKKDGTIITVEISAHDLTFDGKPARLVVANDITARELAEELLRRSELRFTRLSESGIVGILVLDLAGTILEANDTFLKMVGLTREELQPGVLRVQDVTAADSRGTSEAALEEISKRGTVGLFEKDYQRRDGTRVPVIIGAAMLDSKRHISFILDITERKRLEQVSRQSFELEMQNRRIQEATRLKSEFLANMSHELRTPLNAILGFSELLQDGVVPPGSPEHREFLDDIVKSGRHLLQLINDVLDLARVEAGKVDFRPEPIDLEMVAREVMSIVRMISVAKNIRIDVSIDAELREGIFLDPARLKQVLYNFVSNALKFTPAGGVVTVRARPYGEESLLLEVEDTGPGIAPEDLKRLFIEFQQLEAGLAKEHSGTGLGLALTRRLAEAQGGSVGVRSTIGKGSVFHVILPRRTPAGPAQPQFRPRPAPAGAPCVLVIEDDERDQAQLVEALSGAGYAVEAASTGSQALALCRTRKFDAISLDLLLPDMSGQDILRRVRAGGLNRDVPVVVVTIVAERGAIAGFTVQDFLPKPIDAATLISALARAGIRPEQPGSVMVVDDDEGSLKLMAVALTQLGFRAVGMNSAEEALRATGIAPPSAIVLDLLMPGMDGFEFLELLREAPATRRTPVLIWTVKDLNAQEQARLSRSVQTIVRKGHGGIPALLDDLRRFLPAWPPALPRS
jgi:PAS domain S-box-containing protein